MLVKWNDETTIWMDLKVVKEASPIAVANRIDHEPAFTWWVPYTLKKRNRIISKVKTKYWKTTHKYGVRLPKNAAEVSKIDQENGNDPWEKAINKGTKKAKGAYEEVEGCTPKEARRAKCLNSRGSKRSHVILSLI